MNLKNVLKIKYKHFWIAYCHIISGLANYYFCEYDTSLKHRLKSLEVSKQINNNWFVAWNINDIGMIYSVIGDYDIAIEHFQESLLYRKEHQNIHVPLHNIIVAALEKDDIELAQKFFIRLEKHYKEKDINLAYMPLVLPFINALMLKRSTRIRDIAKAEEILKEIVETENEWPEWNINASIHLCDLLLAEYAEIRMKVGSDTRIYRLQTVGVDVAFDRADYKEIGNSEVVQRGVNEKTVTVSLDRFAEDFALEDILASDTAYPYIDPRNFAEDIQLQILIYNEKAHTNFKIGYLVTGLSPTTLNTTQDVQAYNRRTVALESDNMKISDDISELAFA